VAPDKTFALPPCTIVMRVQAWLPLARRQAVLAIAGGLTLWVTAEGAGLTLADREVRIAAPMLKRRWYELRIIAEAGRIRLRQTALQRSWGVTDSGTAEMTGSLGWLGAIVFGAAPAATPRPHENPYTAFLNGRIEDPAIIPGVHDASAALEPDAAGSFAYWDFSQEKQATESSTAGRTRCTAPCATCRLGRYAARAGPAKRQPGGIGHGITPRSISTRTTSTIVAGTPISR
jgi:hypothetical protein